MAVTATHLTTNSSTSNTGSYNTASITPTANRLVLIGILASVGTSPTPTLTVSGCNLTWVQVDTTVEAARTVVVFRAMGGSPSTGALTIASTGGNLSSCLWSVIEYDGVDTSGSNGSGAIQQSFNSKPSSTNNLSVAFPVTPTSGNGGFAGVGFAVQETATAGTGWTGHTTSQSAPTSGLIGLRADTCPANVLASWTTSSSPFVVGVEVKAAASGTTHQITATGSGTSTGSANAIIPLNASASGSGTSTGSAAITITTTISASGTGTSTGSAAIIWNTFITASGSGQTAGSAAITALLQVSASGSGQTAGSAAATIENGSTTHDITASGTGQTDGSAAVTVLIAASTTGTGQTSGSAAITRTTTISASGTAQTEGSAVITNLVAISASSLAQTAGEAALSTLLAISASGTAQTAGSVSMVIAGDMRDITVSAELVASSWRAHLDEPTRTASLNPSHWRAT